MQVSAVEEEFRQDEAVNLEKLYQEHHDQIFRTAFRMTGSSADAEDILQTVFMRILHQDELTWISGSARAYLKRAAVNASLDILRSRRSNRQTPLEDVPGGQLAARDVRPDDTWFAAEIRSWLREAISRLSPRAAEVFVLKYLEGYGNDEIAGLVGTSPSTVAVVLHRTRARLHDEVGEFLGGRR